jgi:acyl-CoA reductase-like NAD-dependent aldehyde dehydrogenase
MTAVDTQVLESRDPANGELLGTVPLHTAADVDAAVAAAQGGVAAV